MLLQSICLESMSYCVQSVTQRFISSSVNICFMFVWTEKHYREHSWRSIVAQCLGLQVLWLRMNMKLQLLIFFWQVVFFSLISCKLWYPITSHVCIHTELNIHIKPIQLFFSEFKWKYILFSIPLLAILQYKYGYIMSILPIPTLYKMDSNTDSKLQIPIEFHLADTDTY